MTCKTTQEFIHAYIDRELELSRSLDIEQHVEVCRSCAIAYNDQMALRSSLKDNSLYHVAPAKLETLIRSSLRPKISPKAATRFLSWQSPPAWVALASVVLITLIAWQFVIRQNRPSNELLSKELVSSHVRSLQLDGHRADVLSSDQHTVKPWFTGKLDYAPLVNDFAGDGFPLIGGRLDYVHNRSVAVLIYKHQQHYINLYTWPVVTGTTSAEISTRSDGYNLESWTSAGMSYWAISDLNAVELREFVRLVQRNGLN